MPRTRIPIAFRWRLFGQASVMAIVAAFGVTPAFAQDISVETGAGYDQYSGNQSVQYLPENFGAPNDQIAPDNGFSGFANVVVQPEGSGYVFRGAVQYGRASTQHASTSYSSFKYTASADVSHSEHHWVGDLQVGRDIGLGGAARAQVYLGVRYANFSTESRVSFQTSSKYGGNNEIAVTSPGQLAGEGVITRDFSGFGPSFYVHVLAPVNNHWAAEAELGASVLFGDADTNARVLPSANLVDRSDNHTVSDFSGSLAIAWTPMGSDGVRLKLGYRYEAFSDVLDSGFDNADASANRYIDGPFASIVWRIR